MLRRVHHLVGNDGLAEFSADVVNGAFRQGWACGALQMCRSAGCGVAEQAVKAAASSRLKVKLKK